MAHWTNTDIVASVESKFTSIGVMTSIYTFGERPTVLVDPMGLAQAILEHLPTYYLGDPNPTSIIPSEKVVIKGVKSNFNA